MPKNRSYHSLLAELEKLQTENAFLRHQIDTHSPVSRMVTDTVYEWSWEVDENAVYTYASPEVEQVLGYTPDELIGRTPFDFMSESEAQRVAGEFERIVQKHAPFSKLLNTVLHKNGSVVHTETSGRPVFDETNTFRGYRGIDFDRTSEINSTVDLKLETNSLKKALDAQDNLLVNVTDTISDLLFYKDRALFYTGCNQAFCDFVGLRKEQIIGKNDFDLFPRHLATAFRENETHVCERRESRSDYEWVTHTDGRHLYLQTQRSPLLDTDGKVIGLVGISRDLTNEYTLEKRLKKANSQLRDAQFLASIGHWEWDITNEQLYWSDEIYRIFGFEPQTFKPTYEAFLERVHPDDRDKVNEATMNSLETRDEYDLYHRILLPDGVERIVHEIGHATYDQLGVPIEMIGTVQDVTSLKQIEQELAESKEAFETIFEYSSDGTLLVEDGKFTACNQAIVDMMGARNKAEFLNVHPSELSPEYQPDGERSFDKANRMIEICLDKGQNHFEWVHRRLNGELFWAEVLATRLFIHGKDVIHVSWRDITERKELADQLESTNKKYRALIDELDARVKEQSAQMIRQSKLAQMGELISMIAHQWRQPLGSIAAVVSSIKLQLAFQNDDKDPEQTAFLDERLEEIERYTLSLSQTIDDFRNLYKPDSSMHLKPLTYPIEKALELIKRSFNENFVTVEKNYGTDETVSMLSSEIMQVVLNLLKNAQDNFIEKQTADPKVTVSTALEGDTALIKVCDNGGGICPTLQERIFEPYFTTKDAMNGTGLGLYMCKLIIENKHHGRLLVANEGDGVCFTIELPRHTVG
jgi:PAS domain S-box-containing protein